MFNFPESLGVRVGPALVGYAERTYVRPFLVQLSVLMLLVFAAAHAYAVRPSTMVHSPSLDVVITTHTQPKTTDATPAAKLPSSASTPIRITPAAVTIPACQTVAYGLPSALDLSGASAGLTQQVDAPAHYQIYGNDDSTVRAQIAQCAPKMGSGEFTGDTSYTINWQYNYSANGDACTLSNAKVGVHINEVLPNWYGSTAVSAGFVAKWQAFMSGLTTHEQGHVSLDLAMANTMLAQLQTFTAPSCETIVSVVNIQMQNELATLNAQNENYDTQTNHGATQGAILP
jgi:predicted secreted Zn-dependent protease